MLGRNNNDVYIESPLTFIMCGYLARVTFRVQSNVLTVGFCLSSPMQTKYPEETNCGYDRYLCWDEFDYAVALGESEFKPITTETDMIGTDTPRWFLDVENVFTSDAADFTDIELWNHIIELYGGSSMTSLNVKIQLVPT